jgi:trehalose-6-phosphate synthase
MPWMRERLEAVVRDRIGGAKLVVVSNRVYAIDEFSEALRLALTMAPEEQEQRMTRMRQEIADHNVYRWAGMLLSEASKLAQTKQMAEAKSSVEVGA